MSQGVSLSFNSIGNEHFTEMLKILRPDISVPSVTRLKTILMDQLYDNIKHEVNKVLYHEKYFSTL